MGAGKQAWGWYPAGKVWVQVQCAIDGKLVIDPTALFEDVPTDGVFNMGPTSNWAHDEQVARIAGTIPSGVICMWSGLIANIPTGWHICDGTAGTPNLLAKFVEGVATAVTNPGATGGSTAKITAGHATPSHTLTVAEMPAHSHFVQPTGAVSTYVAYTTSASKFQTINTNPTSSTGGDGGHVHPSTTDSIADIRPLYYDIAFIMKL